MKFKKSFNIRWHDTNANREITPSAILTFMQETTNAHIQTMYPTLEYIRDELHQAFILSKIYMRFYEVAHAYDDIVVETWTGIESRGFTFYRSFAVKMGDTVIADALTTWCLIDTIELKLLPVSKFENNFVDDLQLITLVDPTSPIVIDNVSDGFAFIYTITGQLLTTYNIKEHNSVVTAPSISGFYLMRIVTGNMDRVYKIKVK